MRWLSDKLDAALAWLANLFQDIFYSLMYMLYDVFTFILQAITEAVLYLLGQLPVPEFLNSGLGTVINSLDPAVLYFLDATQFPEALAILGTGFTFRMMRKLFTLGQW